MAGLITHEALLTLVKNLPEDYEPYGKATRETGDCSCGCKFYLPVAGNLGADWGICCNPISHRAGLLTFEHQGCSNFKGKEHA